MALDIESGAFGEPDELVGSVDGEEVGISVLQGLLLVDFNIGKAGILELEVLVEDLEDVPLEGRGTLWGFCRCDNW